MNSAARCFSSSLLHVRKCGEAWSGVFHFFTYVSLLLWTILQLLPTVTFWNRPFAWSGHVVRIKLCSDANNAVGLSKQRKVGLDWQEFLCFGSPAALFASQHKLFRTTWPDLARGPIAFQEHVKWLNRQFDWSLKLSTASSGIYRGSLTMP